MRNRTRVTTTRSNKPGGPCVMPDVHGYGFQASQEVLSALSSSWVVSQYTLRCIRVNFEVTVLQF
jgi:hypothetical protein